MNNALLTYLKNECERRGMELGKDLYLGAPQSFLDSGADEMAYELVGREAIDFVSFEGEGQTDESYLLALDNGTLFWVTYTLFDN